jgi:CubicO group peptidase (beta-lactamase class C family)
MEQYGIAAGQLAIARAGQVLFSHGYTNTAYTTFITEPTSIMRVASNSKALVCAAITQLYATHVLNPDIHVYAFLGVHAPLLPSQPGDPRAEAITIRQLVAHTAGLSGADDSSSPEFNMWSIEVAAGNTGPLTDAQFTAYLYGQRLKYTPDTMYLYSNDGYYLLARVIEKATGEPYIDWVSLHVLQPLGITDAVVSATALSGRRSNEVLYYDPGMGRSVLTPQVDTTLHKTYGGMSVMEVLDGPASIALSAQSLAVLAGTYNVYGLGGRRPGAERQGSWVGTSSWLESTTDGLDFSFIFDARVDRQGHEIPQTTFRAFGETLGKTLESSAAR